VVTNLSRNPQFVYDDIYVLRGDVENRIKELIPSSLSSATNMSNDKAPLTGLV
jgi:hypothetical protein